MLQHQVDYLLAKHSEDISSRDEAIKQLNDELDTKAGAVVLLTQQLYQARVKLKQEVEERVQKSTACVCPHCYVHQKMSKSVSAESRLGTLHESDPLSRGYDRDTLSADTAVSSQWRTSPPPQSTPPISPHPPPPSATRRHSIKRRASTPIRRHSPSPKSAQSAAGDHTHHLSQQKSLRPALTAKDAGMLSNELQQLLSLKDGSEVKLTRRKETHPVLPPILSSSKLTEDCPQDIHTSSVTLDRTPSGHFVCATVPVPMATDSPQTHHHRRLILAKSKGLSSAPSKLRVLRYSSCSRAEGEEPRGGAAAGGEKEEEEGEGGIEASSSGGTLLMVKETDRKGTRPVGQWAAEGDAYS